MRIATTHAGSLPRPHHILEQLGSDTPRTVMNPHLKAAVQDIVRRQIDLGIDFINDGEIPRNSYATDITHRVSGFSGPPGTVRIKDLDDFPAFAEERMPPRRRAAMAQPTCVASLSYRGHGVLDEELSFLTKAAEDAISRCFFTSPSPGTLALLFEDGHYGSQAAYVQALGEVMQHEYERIAASGVTLQIDAPDLAMGYHVQGEAGDIAAFRKRISHHIAVLNAALRNIPPDRIRMHVCWGNYEGPHHHDVDLSNIVDIVLGARPTYLLIEAANPRHAHEWEVFDSIRLPADKVLVPGVIDPKTSFIEHPKLIAQRLKRYTDLVGPERVVAGVDCGFATFARSARIDRDIIWAKLGALVEGAALLSRML